MFFHIKTKSEDFMLHKLIEDIEKLKKEEKALEYLAVFICGLFLGYIINLL